MEILVLALAFAILLQVFQLGHVFSDMEIETFSYVPPAGYSVSIGPRLFRHGNMALSLGVAFA